MVSFPKTKASAPKATPETETKQLPWMKNHAYIMYMEYPICQSEEGVLMRGEAGMETSHRMLAS